MTIRHSPPEGEKLQYWVSLPGHADIWFTDGYRSEERSLRTTTEAGKEMFVSLGRYAIVFQTYFMALLTCAQRLENIDRVET